MLQAKRHRAALMAIKKAQGTLQRVLTWADDCVEGREDPAVPRWPWRCHIWPHLDVIQFLCIFIVYKVYKVYNLKPLHSYTHIHIYIHTYLYTYLSICLSIYLSIYLCKTAVRCAASARRRARCAARRWWRNPFRWSSAQAVGFLGFHHL